MDDEEFIPVAPKLVEYDPQWVQQYAAEAESIKHVLAGVNHVVQHIGSTAVPGLPAKPVIDIMVGVPDYSRIDGIRAELETIHYVADPHAERDEPSRKVFRKGSTDMTQPRSHHLHLTIIGGDYWRRILTFRDQLRRDPQAAARYAEVKCRMLTECRGDSRAYTAGKHDVVKEIERTAGIDVP